KNKDDSERNEELKLQKKQDDALKKEEEKRKAQLQAASLKNKNKKIAKVIRVDEDLEFLKEMQAQAQKERDELFELQRKNELEHKRIQEEQVIAAKKEKAEIEERISTMTYQSFVEGRQQDRVDDPYTNLKPLFEGYVDIVCGPSTKSTLTSIRQLNLEIVRRHKKLCLRNERISWYFALDEDLRKRASDRFKELEEEVKDKASEKFNHELSTLKDKSMQMKSILKDLEKLLKEAIAAKNKPLMGIYSNAIKSKKIDYENTLRELKQYEVLVAKILHFDQMDALLGGGGLLNTDRLFDETINIADWNRGFLSQEFFENQFSFIDSCIDTVKKIFPTTEFSPYDNLQSQLTSIDLHVLPVIQIILNEIGVSEEKRLNLTEWIINIAHNHAENYALDRFDLDNFNHHTFYYLKNINKDDEIRYSPEQLNDLRKIQIMLIKSYSKIFKKDE
ncbi:MAG: hypothetical protein JO129_04810, partial [Candidatus Dependentiae bacterium]|nr:hypothetical protein [Candidatus Dependentiae bacterium]